jgi:hypothetical protein
MRKKEYVVVKEEMLHLVPHPGLAVPEQHSGLLSVGLNGSSVGS